MNIHGWFPLRLNGLISLLSKGLSSLLQHHSSESSVLQHSAFFMAQLSHLYMTNGKTIVLTIWTFVSKVMSLLFNTLSSSDAVRDWGQEEKGTTEMVGWYHWIDGHESQWTPGVGDGQGGLACCDSWGRKKSDTTERLNWTEVYHSLLLAYFHLIFFYFF